MEHFLFTHGDKTYELDGDKCRELLNDEDQPLAGIDAGTIIALLPGQPEIEFETVYFDQPCPVCLAGKGSKAPYFSFLEAHLALMSKDGSFVISARSPEYKQTSFDRLLREKKVDDSYMASLFVCPECGDYSIEINQCDL